MKQLSVSAREFVDGVTSYMEHEEKAKIFLPRVTDLFAKVTSQAKKQSTAYVASVIDLSAEEKIWIEELLYRLIGHTVTIETRVDASLIAGIRIQVGDWVVDTSFSTQLTRIAQSLIHI